MQNHANLDAPVGVKMVAILDAVEPLLEDNLEICKIGGDRIWVAHVELVDAHQHVSMYAMVRVWAHALIRALRDVLLMHVCDHVQRAQRHVHHIRHAHVDLIAHPRVTPQI